MASATINTSTATSNPVPVTWTAGQHVTFLTLNPSPTGTTTGQPVVVIASLTDISANPTAPLAGQSISFALGSNTCAASTDASGIAACLITPQQAGLGTLTATFAGTNAFKASTASVGFNVVAPQVAETTPPVITISASPKTLWPPNGKMVPVTIAGTITDSGSGVKASTATYAVIDEYGSVHPSGPITLGSNGSYSFTIQLQASRNGNDKDGRQYTITVRAQDNAGNNGAASTGVTVPHDQGH